MFSIPLLLLSIVYLLKPEQWVTLSPKMSMILILMISVSHIIDVAFDMQPDIGSPYLVEVGALLTDFIFGLLLALVAIIGVKNLLRYAPELANGRPVFISVSAFCLSATMCELLRFSAVAIDVFWSPDEMVNMFGLISGLIGSLAGTAITCVIFLFNAKFGFLGSSFDRLVSSDLPPVDEEMGRNGIMELI